MVHNEATVTPENVDAIRAITVVETDGAKSISQTDQSLGIRRELAVTQASSDTHAPRGPDA